MGCFFVGCLEDAPGSSAIVAPTVSFARTLGLEVTSEGVETARQVALFGELGCDLAQGYRFSILARLVAVRLKAP